jgi:predicted Zn-dependent protease
MSIFKQIFQYSETRYIKDFTLFLILTIILYFTYLKVINITFNNIPLKLEEQIWHQVAKNFNIISDDNYHLKNVRNKLKSLPKKILASKYNDIRVNIINSDYINAHAVIGGNVIITKKLLDTITSEEMLMFLIMHEVGHLKYNDHIDEISKSILNKIFLSFMPKEYYIMQNFLPSLNYQRSLQKEYKADNFAFTMLNHIYGNNNAAIDFFDMIIKNNSISDQNNILEISHPLITKRKSILLGN